MKDRLYLIKQRYFAGIYARVSVDKENEKGESVETQLAIGRAFIQSQHNIELYNCYIDIGRTGTNFLRKGFEHMMEDVRMGRINCIIVKDLSRFGRNYIETGNYLEKIFPFLGVRFIAVTDRFDSQNPLCWNDNVNMNLKNLVNEMYAKDIALRVSTSKKEKQEQGSYIGGIPPYGYAVEWIGRQRILVVEKGTSDIVKKLYQLFLSGESIQSIRKWLYQQKIHSPMAYRRSGNIFCQEGEILKKWQQKTVKAILSNSVYTGVLNGKEHTHQGIIDEETFACAVLKWNEIEMEDRKEKRREDLEQPEDIFSGIIYCGGCGGRLIQNLVKRKGESKIQYIQYRCLKRNQIEEYQCNRNSISSNKLANLITIVIQKQFALSERSLKDLIDKSRAERERQRGEQKKTWDRLEKRMVYIRRNNSEQYKRYCMGEQKEENYKKEKRKNEDRLWILEKKQEEIGNVIKDKDTQGKEEEKAVVLLLTKGKNMGFSKDIIQKLVCHIKIWQGQRVEITLLYHLKGLL